MEDLKRLGCAGFLTEFGMGGDTAHEVFDEADLNLQVCELLIGDREVCACEHKHALCRPYACYTDS